MWKVERIDYSVPVGPNVVTPTLDEVLAAIEGLPGDLPWEAAAARTIPLFPRVRPYVSGYPEPVRTIVPPGIAVGFGIDVGPAFLNVTPAMLGDWSLSLADLTAQALANVVLLASGIKPDQIVRESIGDVPIGVLQTGAHIGSTLVLAPAELARLFGPGRRTFIAPMRDLIVGLPSDVNADFAGWLFSEFAAQDPNSLSPRAFLFDGRAISVQPLGPSSDLLPSLRNATVQA